MYPIKLYFRNKAILSLLGVSLLFLLLCLYWIFFRIGVSEGPLFLHYNVLFGVDLIGPWYQILYIPLTGCILVILNSFVGWMLFDKSHFPAILLSSFTAFFNVLLFIALLLLEFLNV
ncbi:hypothetical protein H6758_00680 [Candidatus Nomurabacteria bacterium]|nr:hypothetical protein [Candidatus Nomurabacteria bacterium]